MLKASRGDDDAQRDFNFTTQRPNHFQKVAIEAFHPFGNLYLQFGTLPLCIVLEFFSFCVLYFCVVF